MNYNFIFGGGRNDNQHEVRREKARGTVVLGKVAGLGGLNLLQASSGSYWDSDQQMDQDMQD